MDNKNDEAVFDSKDDNNSQRRATKAILIVIAILMIVGGSIYIGYYLYTLYDANQSQQELSSLAATTTMPERLVNNPIDFDSLKAQNEEIYSWIKVPGTKVDYPICQSATDDEFYLKHSATDKSWVYAGAIYTESCNSLDYSDRVTVIYGHNMNNGSMFASLHKFEKADFFDEHKYFYIYTPKSKLTYEIVSAFKYDNRHIMNSFDFHNVTVFEEFLQMIQNPESNNKNVRQLDRELTKDDKVVVLSTCIGQKSSRYLTCGVLVKDEKTN